IGHWLRVRIQEAGDIERAGPCQRARCRRVANTSRFPRDAHGTGASAPVVPASLPGVALLTMHEEGTRAVLPPSWLLLWARTRQTTGCRMHAKPSLDAGLGAVLALLALITAILLSLVGVRDSVSAATQYTIVDLGTNFTPAAVNDNGLI